jgi:hypothetical protein
MSPVPYPYSIECYGSLAGGGHRYVVKSFPTQEALLAALPALLEEFGAWTRVRLTAGHGQKEGDDAR